MIKIASLLRAGFASLALLPVAPQANAQSSDPVRATIEPIVTRFMSRLAECRRSSPFTPTVVIDNHPTLISYYSGDQSVHATRWSALPPEIKGMMDQWAAKGTLGLSGEGQFAEIFNSLLVPHELGHFAADTNGRAQGQSFWDGEVYANRVAIAFWKGERSTAEELPGRLENYNRFLDALPNPVPDGQTSKAWFEANYEKLGENPQAYGWYQGLFMREARQQSDKDSFCKLIGPE